MIRACARDILGLMANVRHLHPSQLVNRRGGRGRGLVVPLDEGSPRPYLAPPRSIGAPARRIWREFWLSSVALAVDLHADRGRLLHWIRAVDERERLEELIRSSPLTVGTNGKLTPNPLTGRVRDLTRDIERAEEAFGMTPLSRFRLQFEFAEAGRASIKFDSAKARAVRDRLPSVNLDEDE